MKDILNDDTINEIFNSIRKRLIKPSEFKLIRNNTFQLCFEACRSGDLQVIKYLYELSRIDHSIKFDIYKCNYALFYIACKNNHIEIVNWLSDLNLYKTPNVKISEWIQVD